MLMPPQNPGSVPPPPQNYGSPQRSSSTNVMIAVGIVFGVGVILSMIDGRKEAQKKIGERNQAKRDDLARQLAEIDKTPSVGTSKPDPSETRARKAKQDLGLDPDKSYPYFPLVYDPNWRFGNDGYLKVADGVIRNYGSQTVYRARVSFRAFDRSESVLGTYHDYVDRIEPGETWKYKVVILTNEAASVALDNITFR